MEIFFHYLWNEKGYHQDVCSSFEGLLYETLVFRNLQYKVGSSLGDQEQPRTPLPSSILSIHQAEGCLISLL